MVAGLAGSLPHTLTAGLTAQGVPAADARTIASLPLRTLFAAFLGYNPVQQLLGPHVLGQFPPDHARTLTGREFFPQLISGPFHDGLVVVFWLAIAMSLVAAGASLVRGRRRPLRRAVPCAGGGPAPPGAPPRRARHAGRRATEGLNCP
ncbi:hypothetical protein ACIG5E_28780 [Kitasatospora sp. NPDC053057]|uniref:hypothetical protein n=1 Tax=Kitasatospora sp. NPDC053057 TaxID=3364062 RepID=UPI0037C523EC